MYVYIIIIIIIIIYNDGGLAKTDAVYASEYLGSWMLAIQ